MAKKRLKRKFFNQPTLKVAKYLLGKYLVRKIGKNRLVGKILETEAYIGPNDRASHASFGKTERCKPMYDLPGIAYVYFIYGMYWMLNIVTEKKGRPCAVLIRAIEPLKNQKSKRRIPSEYKNQKVDFFEMDKSKIKKLKEFKKLGSGPGKLCRWMKIDGRFNGKDLTKSKNLFIVDSNEKIKERQIVSTTRIGVDYAGQWAKKPWRFYIKDNPFVSKK